MSARGEIVLGKATDMPPGSVTVVPYGRSGIGIYNVDGEFHAINNMCPHRGAPLCQGPITGAVIHDPEDEQAMLKPTQNGEFLECPWHGWRFEIATGRAEAFPDKRARMYKVRVEGGNVILKV